MDQVALYDIMYALAARDGREAALFGDCALAAREAFLRSQVGEVFPELWLEFPLAGDPWLDFHALISYVDVAGTQATFSGQGGAYADALAWFAAQEPDTVRQLALSYDTSTGDVGHPAVQLLVHKEDLKVPLGFLEAVGRPDAVECYRAFAKSMPGAWYACYVGVFPRREAGDADRWVRVECIVSGDWQRTYADSKEALREHLAHVGLQGASDEAVDIIQVLARSPFPLELQFNVGPGGKVLPVVSASVRFQPQDWLSDERRQAIEQLACQLEGVGLVDERWKLLSSTSYAKRVAHHGESTMIACFPAFVKVRWREGMPLDAKAYLLALVQ